MDTEASCALYSVFLKPIQAQRYWPIPSLFRVAVALTAILWLSGGSDMAAAQAITRVATINTLAGDGTAGYLGDSGPATSAELNGPYGLVIDNSGNLYIADPANNRIRKVALGTGIISTFVGNGTAGYSGDNGPATSAELQVPVGVALDGKGDLYIADEGNSVIRKVNASGTITTVAGNNTVGYSGDNGLATSASLYAPSGVAVDSSGNLYIADAGNNRIREVAAATGIITTIAGTGTAGYSGDNGAAVSATLNKPSAVLEGSTGNLYVLDTGNDVVRLVNTTGTITTIAGNGNAGYSGDNGPATSATLHSPYGLNIDSSGNLYVADSANNAVRMVSTAGIISTIAGTGTAGYSGDNGAAISATLDNPQGVTIDSQGNVYISDQSNNRVREVSTPTGSVLFPTTPVNSTSIAVTVALEVNTAGTTITGITAPASQGNKQEYTVTATGCAPNTALAAGTVCNVTATFAPGYAGPRPVPLQVASSAGTFNFGLNGIGTAPLVALSPGIITTVAGTAPVSGSSNELVFTGGLAIDSAGNIYAAGGQGYTTNVIEIAAGTGAQTDLLPSGFTYSENPTFGVAVDSAGDVYFVNPEAACVFRAAPGSAVPTVVAGIECNDGVIGGDTGYSGDNGPATNAQLNYPLGVAVDSADNVYVADTGNNRIRKIEAATGIITTVAGNGNGGASGDDGPAVDAELGYPTAVAVDSAGNLYIADRTSATIRKVGAGSGIITTVAGTGVWGTSTGDGGPATSAQLGTIYDVKVDSAGDFYIADGYNYVVRMVNTAGTITTVAGNGTAGGGGDGGSATAAEVAPGGLAIDSAGNFYIGGAGVRVVNVSAGALNFASAQVGANSTKTVAVTNIGNAPLAFTVPTSGQNPSISAGFTLDSSSTCPQLSTGSQPSSVASGTSCSLAIDFAPTTAAAITGTASIADNSLSASQVQTEQLSGGAGETVATTTTINVTTPVFGQTQIGATILGTSGTLTPVGSVVFTVDGAVQPAITVNSSGVAPLPSAVANALAVGSHTIAAVYTSSSLGFSNSNATRIFSVTQVPPTIAIAPSTTSLSVAPGASVTDTITVTSMGGYSGALQFSCTGLPQNATCSFQPATVTVSATSGPQTTMVTIQTAGSTAKMELGKPLPSPNNTPLLPAAAFWAPGLLTMALGLRRRKFSSSARHLTIVLSLAAGAFLLNGCGGGSSTTQSTAPSQPTTPSAPVTPAGTSTVQITAANSGSTVQSLTLTLTVQ
jgi:sugar lactone lactonase YvrE